MRAFIPGHSGFHAQTANSLFCPCGNPFTVPVFLYSFPLKAALMPQTLTRGSIKANEAWEDMRGRRGMKPNGVEDDITSIQLIQLWRLNCSTTSFNISIMSKEEGEKKPIIIREVLDLIVPDGNSRFKLFIVISTVGKMFLCKRKFFFFFLTSIHDRNKSCKFINN